MRKKFGFFILAAALPAVLVAAQTPLERARTAGQQGDWQASISAYREHLAGHPDDAWSWYALGATLHGVGDFGGASEAFERSLASQVSLPSVAHYNLACSRARAGDAEGALASLAEAVPAGIFSAKAMYDDPDLTSLQGDPRFAEVARSADLTYRPCMLKEEYRQFDFWIGSWEVRIAGGLLAGRSRIEQSSDRCVLTQSWEGVFGTEGRSWSYYDAARDRWTQTWVGRGGVVATMEGGLRDGAMVLEGAGTTGPSSRVRTVWRPNEDGTLTVTTWTSDDDGATWAAPTATTSVPAAPEAP